MKNTFFLLYFLPHIVIFSTSVANIIPISLFRKVILYILYCVFPKKWLPKLPVYCRILQYTGSWGIFHDLLQQNKVFRFFHKIIFIIFVVVKAALFSNASINQYIIMFIKRVYAAGTVFMIPAVGKKWFSKRGVQKLHFRRCQEVRWCQEVRRSQDARRSKDVRRCQEISKVKSPLRPRPPMSRVLPVPRRPRILVAPFWSGGGGGGVNDFLG